MNRIIFLVLILTTYLLGIVSGHIMFNKEELNHSQIEIHLEKIQQEIILNSKTLSNISTEYQQLDRRIRGIAAECGKIAYQCEGVKK